MKSALFFMLFFVNALCGFYFRNPIAFGFSVLALTISILFASRERVEDDEDEKKEELETEK